MKKNKKQIEHQGEKGTNEKKIEDRKLKARMLESIKKCAEERTIRSLKMWIERKKINEK